MFVCQKCGTNILTRNQFGTNYDNSINRDFCADCYKNGSFVSNVEHYNDFALFMGACALGQLGNDYYNGIGVPLVAPYFVNPIGVIDEENDFRDL